MITVKLNDLKIITKKHMTLKSRWLSIRAALVHDLDILPGL